MKKLIDELYENNYLNRVDLLFLLENISREDREYLYDLSRKTRSRHYGRDVYLRGLLEISNYCKKECIYCGINRKNFQVKRYRLEEEEILESCRSGYGLGFKTFVLQAGEDVELTDEKIVSIVRKIKDEFQDVAVTLSLGERNYNSYKKFYQAGADRYLLRHETADSKSYERIHKIGNFETRKKCLYDLKDVGFQVGAGFMVGIPGEDYENIADDILFLKELNPAMVGIGPFIPHKDTIYGKEIPGSLDDCLLSLAVTRLFLPDVLLPATTALSTISKKGRKLGLMAGCNVIMPNLSPLVARDNYSLYENKAYESLGDLEKIRKEVESLDLEINMSRGDNINWR